MRIPFFQLKVPLTDPWTEQITYGQHYLSGLQKFEKQLDKVCAFNHIMLLKVFFLNSERES